MGVRYGILGSMVEGAGMIENVHVWFVVVEQIPYCTCRYHRTLSQPSARPYADARGTVREYPIVNGPGNNNKRSMCLSP